MFDTFLIVNVFVEPADVQPPFVAVQLYVVFCVDQEPLLPVVVKEKAPSEVDTVLPISSGVFIFSTMA